MHWVDPGNDKCYAELFYQQELYRIWKYSSQFFIV